MPRSTSFAASSASMFFPDRSSGYAEARRVLRPGGRFLFSVWDRIEENVFADDVTNAVAAVFPRRSSALPRPHAARLSRYRADPQGSGAGRVLRHAIETRARGEPRALAPPAAIAYCQGTPLRNEIEARDAEQTRGSNRPAASAIAHRHGNGEVAAKIQARVFWRGLGPARPHRLMETGFFSHPRWGRELAVITTGATRHHPVL